MVRPDNKKAVRLVCGNCAVEAVFESFDDAFQKGWDTVERFGYNSCDECPGVSVYFPMYYCQEAKQYPAGSEMYEELIQKATDATWEFTDKEETRKKIEEAMADPRTQALIKSIQEAENGE